jgi:ribosomal-protein-alanine N-acetyltransferase
MSIKVITQCLKDNLNCVLEIDKTSTYYHWSRQMFLQELGKKNSFFNILKEDDIIAGYIIYNVVLDEAEILNIVIGNNFKRKEYATFLLTRTINDMIKKNIKTIFLEVGQNNIAAINLYLKFGFEQYGIRKEYYKNKENAILMKRQLKA